MIDNENLKDEYMELIIWFAEYDIQCNQYRRCLDLNNEYDRDIIELHNEAELKAIRLNEIKTELITQ